MTSGQTPRNALPSASFGNMPATTLSVGIRFHIGTKQPPNVSAPKKNIVVYLNGTGLAGSAWRPKNQACHGTTVDRHGNALRLADLGDRVRRLGRGGRDDQVDVLLEDQVLGDLRGAVRVGLGVPTTISTS